MTEIFDFQTGSIPILISIPHLGTRLPEDIAQRMTARAKTVPDTDWDLDRLYDFAGPMGAHIIAARYSRYVVDLNRPGDNASLYPGQTTTGLVPGETFAGEPLYQPGQEPDDAEIAHRRQIYWQPYQDKIRDTLAAIKSRCGFAVLFDCHSIKSEVPRLFDGTLPDLNLGTNDGKSCAAKSREDSTGRSEGRLSIAITSIGGASWTRTTGAPHVVARA